MFKNLWNKLFPSPSFGLDISDESLNLIELIPLRQGFRVGRFEQRRIPDGIIASGRVKDPKKLEKILLSLKKDFGLRSVNVSLPDEMADEGGSHIGEYISVFQNAGIYVKSFVPRSEALSYSITPKGEEGSHMIIDHNKNQTLIFVISGGKVALGSAITSDQSHLLREEAAQHFLNWHTRGEGQDNRLPIKKIILSGNQPNLKEFSEYLSVGLRLRVEVANVWVNVVDTEKFIPEITFEQSFIFAPALGTALRDSFRG